MGTIMAVGVAVANSILLVTFAERSRLQGRAPSAAAIEGATSRLRPIVMTGAAMIAGTIPMALGLGEGGEQTAPLGRAVIGGLSGALCATLLALPAIFTMLAPRSRTSASLDPGDPQSRHFEGGDLPPDDRGDEQVESKMPPKPGPRDQPGQHDEPCHPHTTDDDRSSLQMESETPVDAGLEDRENPVPYVTPDQGAVARIKSEIDISDRARIGTFGNQAQRAVVDLADRILAQTQNGEIGTTGDLLAGILAKARRLDPAAVNEGNYLTRMFSSAEARIQRFSEQFGTAASHIDRIRVDLERNKESLRRGIAILDELYEQTRMAIANLDAHIAAGKAFAEEFRAGRLVELEALAKSSSPGSDAVMAAHTHQDAVQALDRLEKRIFYLQQARQISIQQLPQIRILQSNDETLIENLQAMTELTIPAWKQKMILLLGHNRRRSALALHRTVNNATNQMMRQASAMMMAQPIGIEPQYQRDDPPVEALHVHAIDHESERVERDSSTPLGLQDQQSPHVEAHDVRQIDDNHDGEQTEHDTAPLDRDLQTSFAEVPDLHTTDDGRRAGPEGDTPAPLGPQDQQSPPVEAHEMRAIDDDHDEPMEGETMTSGLTDHQSAHVEARDSRTTDDDPSVEQVVYDTPAPPGPEDQQRPPAEGRDPHATDDDQGSGPGDRDDTE
jgi:uncharacterized protein YaaN involved in tellurite resistance